MGNCSAETMRKFTNETICFLTCATFSVTNAYLFYSVYETYNRLETFNLIGSPCLLLANLSGSLAAIKRKPPIVPTEANTDRNSGNNYCISTNKVTRNLSMAVKWSAILYRTLPLITGMTEILSTFSSQGKLNLAIAITTWSIFIPTELTFYLNKKIAFDKNSCLICCSRAAITCVYGLVIASLYASKVSQTMTNFGIKNTAAQKITQWIVFLTVTLGSITGYSRNITHFSIDRSKALTASIYLSSIIMGTITAGKTYSYMESKTDSQTALISSTMIIGCCNEIIARRFFLGKKNRTIVPEETILVPSSALRQQI